MIIYLSSQEFIKCQIWFTFNYNITWYMINMKNIDLELNDLDYSVVYRVITPSLDCPEWDSNLGLLRMTHDLTIECMSLRLLGKRIRIIDIICFLYAYFYTFPFILLTIRNALLAVVLLKSNSKSLIWCKWLMKKSRI